MDKVTQNIELLVLTDRYPPYSVGGAELSLQSILRNHPKYDNILVVSLFSKSKKIEKYQYNGIQVISFPEFSPFPFHFLNPRIHFYLRKIKFIYKIFKKIISYIFVLNYKSKFPGFSNALVENNIKNDLNYIYSNLYFLKELKQICSNYHINTIHYDNFRSIALSSIISAKNKVCVIRDNRFRDALDGLQEKSKDSLTFKNSNYLVRNLEKMDKIMVTSEFLKNQFNGAKFSSSIHLIPNPVDISEIPLDADIIPELPLFNIVIIGMLTESKGQIQFLKNLSQEIASNLNLKIHFLGRGPRIRERIEHFSNIFNISDRVVMHGYQSRRYTLSLIKSCQLVVIPSMWDEPFGRVPLEAALMKKACVSFDSGGLVESIIHDQTGIIIEKGDFKKLYESIVQLQNNPEKRIKMGLNAYSHLLEKYDIVNIKQKFDSIWFEKT